jgi:hypothetical protein
MLLLSATLAGALASCGSSDGDATVPVSSADGGAAASSPSSAGGAPSSGPGTSPATADGDATSTPATSPDGSASTPPSGSQACVSSHLAGSFAYDEGGAAAGSTGGTITLRNTGDAACTLRGFPGVSFVDGDGHQLGAAASRDGRAISAVTLDPGGSVGASLRIVNVQNYDAADCQPTAASGLRVYPPGERAALFIEQTFQACAKPVHTATVGPVRDS